VVSLALHGGFLGLFNHKAAAAKDAGPQEVSGPVRSMPPDEEKDDKPKELDDTPVEDVHGPAEPRRPPVRRPDQRLYPAADSAPPAGHRHRRRARSRSRSTSRAPDFGAGVEDLYDVSDLDQKPVWPLPARALPIRLK
jgi:hypothetical protein